MAKIQTWFTGFIKGFTIFHAVGAVCVLVGFFIGDVPEQIQKRAEKLMREAKDIEKGCTVIDRATKNKICFLPVDDVKSLGGAAKSLADDAKKIVGDKGELNVFGSKIPFQITDAQILGILIFFFGTLNSILKSRFGGKEKQ